MRLDIVPYRPDHHPAWIALNEFWILDGGYAIEAKDRLTLDDPDGSILARGGAIFMVVADIEVAVLQHHEFGGDAGVGLAGTDGTERHGILLTI